MNAQGHLTIAASVRRGAGLGLALTALVGLAACGGTNKATSTAKSTAEPNPQPSASAGATGAGTTVTVEESEFKLKLSTTTFSPGVYTFVAKNVGSVPHAIVIEGPGVQENTSDTIAGGATTSITVTLQAGKYEIYCPVGHHKANGMDMDFTVA